MSDNPATRLCSIFFTTPLDTHAHARAGRAAGFEEFLCANNGRHHTTSSRVIKPIIEPRALSSAELAARTDSSKVPSVTWDQLDKLDINLANAVRNMTLRYGYNLDPAFHPQSLSTEEFKA